MAINDRNIAASDFWCNIAAESIYNAADRRAKAVETLKTVITWAFGLFSTGGFVISVFGSIKDFEYSALIWFGISFFLLTIAYSVVNMAEYPVAQTFNTQDPAAVALSFSTAIKKQASIFNVAVWISSAGFFCFALGLLLRFENAKTKVIITSQATPLLLSTSVSLKDSTMFIPITVKASKGDTVNLAIYDNTITKPGITTGSKLLFAAPFQTDTSGIVNYSFTRTNSSNISIVSVAAIVNKQNKDTFAEQKRVVYLRLN